MADLNERNWDRLWLNARIATMQAGDVSYGAIEDGALAAKDGRIVWVGPRTDLPDPPNRLATTVHDCRGRWLLPGLIDCHTHIVYAGNRAREFAMRLEGASYEEIARAGGGIVSTVRAVRAASEDDLLEAGAPRVRRLMAEGVTTIEIKSGYGLDTATELRMLRAARRIGAEFPLTVTTTLLGAHAVPPEFAGRADAFIDLVCTEMIPDAKRSGLADAVDAFCEGIAFTPVQTGRVFDAARAHGLPVKLHADQLSNLHGAALAARHGALSADHLEYTDEDGARAMAGAGTVAVLLPGAFYTLRETKLPPIADFRRHGVPIAIATDSNPGSSPVVSLLLMLNMACTLFRITTEEALAGVTRNAAQALGMGAGRGTLEAGKAADLALYDIDDPAELCYRVGDNPCTGVVQAGKPVFGE